MIIKLIMIDNYHHDYDDNEDNNGDDGGGVNASDNRDSDRGELQECRTVCGCLPLPSLHTTFTFTSHCLPYDCLTFTIFTPNVFL